MSDIPQGPDWWQASDDKWYPPPRPAMPGDNDATAVAQAAMVPPGAAPTGPPLGPPTGPPTGPPSGGFAPPGPGGFPPGGAPVPYGAMPAGPHQGGQNRTPLLIAIGVVVAAALVLLVVVLSSGDDGGTTTASPPGTEGQPNVTEAGGGTTADPTGGTGTTAAEPAGAQDIQVVDSGFSNFMGGFDGDERSVAYGFIVENKGGSTATDISVSVSAYDASGNAVATGSHTIYLLRPGEKVGIGDEFFGTTFTTDVDRVDFQVGEPSGLGSGDVPDEGTLTAEGISTQSDDYSLTTTFTAKSTYAEQLDYPSAYAIYRDANNKIVGGSTGTVEFIPANGSIAGQVRSYEAIPNVASTEVYLDPGFFG